MSNKSHGMRTFNETIRALSSITGRSIAKPRVEFVLKRYDEVGTYFEFTFQEAHSLATSTGDLNEIKAAVDGVKAQFNIDEVNPKYDSVNKLLKTLRAHDPDFTLKTSHEDLDQENLLAVADAKARMLITKQIKERGVFWVSRAEEIKQTVEDVIVGINAVLDSYKSVKENAEKDFKDEFGSKHPEDFEAHLRNFRDAINKFENLPDLKLRHLSKIVANSMAGDMFFTLISCNTLMEQTPNKQLIDLIKNSQEEQGIHLRDLSTGIDEKIYFLARKKAYWDAVSFLTEEAGANEDSGDFELVDGSRARAGGVEVFFQKAGRGSKVLDEPSGFIVVDIEKRLTSDVFPAGPDTFNVTPVALLGVALNNPETVGDWPARFVQVKVCSAPTMRKEDTMLRVKYDPYHHSCHGIIRTEDN